MAHYWTVTLVPPAGASTGLQQYIMYTQDVIQLCVDLLGVHKTPPPTMKPLVQGVDTAALGQSTTTDQYKQAAAALATQTSALASIDDQLAQTITTVANGQDATLSQIQQIVQTLQGELDAVGSGQLKAADEAPLMADLSDALTQVLTVVGSTSDTNTTVANNVDSTTNTGVTPNNSQQSSGSGGGSDTLGQILQALAMLPMAAAQMLPSLLQAAGKTGTQDHTGTNGSGVVPSGTSTPAGLTPGLAAAVAPATEVASTPAAGTSSGAESGAPASPAVGSLALPTVGRKSDSATAGKHPVAVPGAPLDSTEQPLVAAAQNG